MSDKYVITIDADTIAALKKLKEVGNEAKDAAKQQTIAAKDSGEAWKVFKGTLAALGVQELFRGIGSAAATAFKSSITSALELESGLGKVQTLLSKTQNAQELFTENVLGLQSKYGTAQKDSLAAYYDVLSSGATDAAGAIEVLDVANKLAIGGVTTLTIAQDGLTSVLNGYGLAASESAHIADVLFLGAKAGKTDIAGLSQNLGQVAPIAHTMNVSLEELVASISAITTAGVPTSEAVTQVRSALIGLSKPTETMSGALKSLGIESIQAAISQFGLVGVLNKVMGTTNGSIEALTDLFGRVEAVGAVTSLTSTKIGGVFVDALGEMRASAKSAGSVTEESFGAIAATTQFKLNAAIGTAEANMTRLGTAMNSVAGPAAISLIKNLNDLALVPLVKSIKENTEALGLLAKGLLGGATLAGLYAASMYAADAANLKFLLSVAPIAGLLGVSAAAIYLTIKYVDELSLAYLNAADNIAYLTSLIPGMSDVAAKQREDIAQMSAAIQKSIDKREAQVVADKAAADSATAAAEVRKAQSSIVADIEVANADMGLEATKAALYAEADASMLVAAQRVEHTKTRTKEQLKEEQDFQKKLADIQLKARIDDEALKILQADNATVENDARLVGLQDQLGKEAGARAEAQLRILESEKKTVENVRALELAKVAIHKQTTDAEISEAARSAEGQLTKAEEKAKKIRESEEKLYADAKTMRDGDLNYFMNAEDRKVDYEKLTQRQKLDSARDGFSALANLSKDGNKTLGEIGKAAAIAGATIDTYRSATSIFASLAWAGPVIAGAAAAAAVVGGLANVRQIAAQRYERGGIVSGSSYTGDNIHARVNSGELILNRAQQKNLAPQLSGNDNSDIVNALAGVRSDIQNLKLIIGDEDVFSAVVRQKEAGRTI